MTSQERVRPLETRRVSGRFRRAPGGGAAESGGAARGASDGGSGGSWGGPSRQRSG